ncbi:hypothetical protein INR49_007617 [Caranx melampygus]|nr:hypothetical protein INR49_007617 [Caranx melampygus]
MSYSVPDQCVSFVDQYDQLIQQQLLSSLLGLGLLPVCNDTTGTRTVRDGHTQDIIIIITSSLHLTLSQWMRSYFLTSGLR